MILTLIVSTIRDSLKAEVTSALDEPRIPGVVELPDGQLNNVARASTELRHSKKDLWTEDLLEAPHDSLHRSEYLTAGE